MAGENKEDDIATRSYERMLAEFNRSVASAEQAATAAIRALLLLNGGACIALLTFLGGLASGRAGDKALGLTTPMTWFAWGAGLAVVTSILAYFTNLAIANANGREEIAASRPYLRTTAASKRLRRASVAFHYLGVLVAVASLVMFFLGVNTMIGAVRAV